MSDPTDSGMRMEKLEATFAYHERDIADTNELVYGISKRVDRLEALVSRLTERMMEPGGEKMPPLPDDERPPHY
ncbi:MAG: SlyX family protein [Spirochaetes bacterium]|nr:SlyX family protein [Spirochaetota bacterium]